MNKNILGRAILFGSLMLVILVLSVSAGVAQENGGLKAVPSTITVSDSASGILRETDGPTNANAKGALTPQDVVAAELETISIIVTYDETVNPSSLEAVTDGEVIHQFGLFNGASMVVDGEKVESVANYEGVTGVYLDRLMQPDGEGSLGLIGTPLIWDELGGQGSAGEGVIVGVLDTGIWPEHPSYSDPDPYGKPYDPPPVAPASNGFTGNPRSTCDFGNTEWNPNDAPFSCNNKLIGAYDFTDTYKAVDRLMEVEFWSARDANGHGTHTSSTAAGNGGVAADTLGVPRDTVSGVAPRAHIIMYKVCNYAGCYLSDSVAAIEQAVLDGVDTINYSISGGADPYNDLVELAFKIAYDNGVFVAASAGNSGPSANSVAHRGPWTTTVAASTADRNYLGTLKLEAANGDTLHLEGASLTQGIYEPTQVVFPPAGQELCLTPFPSGTFDGKIAICRRGAITRVAKSFNVAAGGASGMLLYNPSFSGVATDNHFVPSVHLGKNSGQLLLDFMASHESVTAALSAGEATEVRGDMMASFSSRGGPGQALGISKPDIAAPGVQILAGHTPLPATVAGGLPGQLFQTIQGTSMSSPHVAGSAALIKAMHPDWTPGQIKSALMMTANGNHFKEDGVTPADPFDDGSGLVDLSVAGNPGLTISDTTANFMALQDELWNANYPSLYVPNMPGQITVQRTVHSENLRNAIWNTDVDSPADMMVIVPPTLTVPAGGDVTFDITVDARYVPNGEVRHAILYLTLGSKSLRFPITIVRGQPPVILDMSCLPDTITVGQITDCTITIANTGFEDAYVTLEDKVPRELELIEGSVDGADQVNKRLISFKGTMDGANSAEVRLTAGELFSYTPLSTFGFTAAGCPSNCDDGGLLVTGLDINYMGHHYTEAIWSVNGTLELGTSSGLTASFGNQSLPGTAIPNNVLAPWWTDLNLGIGGDWYIGALSDGERTWDVLEWENAPRFSDPSSTFSFQIWLERGTDHITFAYGPFTGDTLDGTTGAENGDGSVGHSYYFDGSGTLPWGGNDLSVLSSAAAPGRMQTITFAAKGSKLGHWTDCAELTSDLFQGVNTACIGGEILRPEGRGAVSIGKVPTIEVIGNG